VEYVGDLDSSRSEMALLPRRCPRLLLIQIPTSSVLGPFCIFLRSPWPLCYSVLTSLAWSTWRTGATLSLLLARDFRACLFLSFHLAVSSSRFDRHPVPRFPTESFSFPLDNDPSWNTMEQQWEARSVMLATIDDRWDRAHHWPPTSEGCLYFCTRHCCTFCGTTGYSGF